MMPNNTSSSIGMPSPMLEPDINVSSSLVDFEEGGPAINDTSQGLKGTFWQSVYDAGTGWISLKPGAGAAVQVYQIGGVDEFSFTFDQNMRPAIAWVQGGTLRLRWFDSVINNFRVDTFSGNGRNPRLTMDDKRQVQLPLASDILFAYLRGDSLYYRQQRDRFTVERLLRSGLSSTMRLKNIGMGKNWRMQFELVES